jgi:2-polyprenyl-3-methyl-5-hydroxy-6-metoxy-1,4-benzoquinol methylase
MPDLDENVAYWNSDFHWRYGGDEWSAWWGGPEPQWQVTIYPRIRRFLPTRRLLEIAPGFGRWTEFLRSYCDELVGIDLSKKCIKACRRRFRNDRNLTFHVNDGKSLEAVRDRQADFVFSFDSLVHVERDVMDAYIHEIARVLTDDGAAFIHHSNMAAYPAAEVGPRIPHWRTGSVSAETVAEAAAAAGLSAFRQELIRWGDDHHFLNDSLSWIARAGSLYDSRREVVANENFMQETRTARGYREVVQL